jgi:hypothetical protein
MVWRRLQMVLLTSAITAVAALPVKAHHHCGGAADECCAPAANECCAAAPSPCTVKVMEWVPEQYTTTRTAYRVECRQENYTAYRTECVPETRTRTCTFYKMVPEVRTLTRTVCECVPVTEQRTCMETFVTCRPCTKMVSRCVDRGHWECREVPCGPSCWDRIKKHCHWHHHCGCCEECCAPCCPPRTKTVKCWVPCKVWEQVPCTTYERVCESRPVTRQVCTYKTVSRQVPYQVTCCRCVPEQRTESYTVMVSRCVPFQATRTVSVCVPYQQTVTCCRMVCHEVERPAPACGCGGCCETTCCKPAHRCHHHLGCFHHRGCCGAGSCCN